MTVYVVLDNTEYEGYTINSVWATYEQAEAHAKQSYWLSVAEWTVQGAPEASSS